MTSETIKLSFTQVSKELLSMAVPMALTQLIAVGSGFLCMAMISGLGHDVLAASALIFSSRISIIIIGASILFSLSILIGHAYGEGEHVRIGNFMQQGWILGLLLSIPIMLMFWKIDSILLLLGQRKELTDITQQFFHANIWNVIPFMLSVCNQQLCYGTRKQRIDLIANVLGVIALLISSYLFIFGNFGFPQLGVAGLGYALDLQGWVYFLFTTTIIAKVNFFKSFHIFPLRFKQNWQDLVRMFKVGWPICVQIGGEMLSFIVTAAMVGWLSIASLAAYQVVTQYLFLIVVPLFSLAQASGVLIGQANGANNQYKIKLIGRASLILTIIITALVAIVFIFNPTRLASLYLNVHDPVNQQTTQLIVIFFTIIAIQQIFDGIKNVSTGSLRGLFDTKYPMYVGLSAVWLIAIPLGYVLAFTLNLGLSGIGWGSAAGMFIGMVLVLRRWEKLTN